MDEQRIISSREAASLRQQERRRRINETVRDNLRQVNSSPRRGARDQLSQEHQEQILFRKCTTSSS